MTELRSTESAVLETARSLGRTGRILAALLVAVLLGSLVYALWPSPAQRHGTAYFSGAVGIFQGSDVRVLGVRIGRVTGIHPEGTRVRIDFAYDAKRKIPADAKAVLISSSIVSDRYLQLTPVYRSGAVMADHAVIDENNTAVPVELDRIFADLDKVTVDLGPQGANSSGAAFAADRRGLRQPDGGGRQAQFDREGRRGRGRNPVGQPRSAVQRGRQSENPDRLSVGRRSAGANLNAELADVAGQLAAERGDLAATLKDLQTALADVTGFVHDNKDKLPPMSAA